MRAKLVVGCLVPVLVVGGLGYWGYKRLTAKPPKLERLAVVDRGVVEVKVVETGTIEPLKKVEIKSKVAGRLAKLYVDEGDRVVKGQVLAEIDPTEINSQVEQIRAQVYGARARLAQALKNVSYQKEQTDSLIRQAQEAVASAEARLRSAETERASQPAIVSSDVRQAEASLESAQKNLDLLKKTTQPQALVQVQAGLDEAKAAYEQAERHLERQRSLLKKGFVSQQAVDAAVSEQAAAASRLAQAKKRMELLEEQQRMEVAEAEARVAQARAALDRAKTSERLIRVRDDDVQAAKAVLEQARAQLRAALSGRRQDKMREDDVAQARSAVTQVENQLREVLVRQHDTRLVATMSGVVTKRYVEQGELITSGVSTFSSGTPVLQVADLSRMLIKASVNEVDVQKVRIGLPVEITVDGARGVVFTGRVQKVAPSSIGVEGSAALQRGEGAVVRFAVEVEVHHPTEALRPGMSARCSIIVARKQNVLRLPTDAVEGNGTGASVQVATETSKDGKKTVRFERKTIVAGLRGDNFVEILSGLEPGQKVKAGIFTGPKRKGVQLEFGGEARSQ